VRLKNAMMLLQNGVFTVSEVTYKAGFGSPAYFNKCFREFFGCTPGEVKKSDPNTHSQHGLFHDADENLPRKTLKRNYLLTLPGILILVLLLGTAGFFVYKTIRNSYGTSNLISSDGRISLVVMPFRNITNDTTWNVWQEAIQGSLISSLSNCKELKVRQKENINTLLQNRDMIKYSSISPALANTISQKLDAKIFIYGSIEQAGPSIRVEVQLINTKTNEVLKSFILERPSKVENIFQIIDTLSIQLKNFLLISKLIKEHRWLQDRLNSLTSSPEALRYNIYDDNAFSNGDWSTAISWYLKALTIDSNYFEPMIGLSSAYSHVDIDQDLNWVLMYYKKKD
jgi:TolB-like protein